MNPSISIYEVGPRDGIQIFKELIPMDVKVALITALAEGGLTNIEMGSFVHPKLVPNMADSDELFKQVAHLDVNLGVLVPNHRGIKRAISVGAINLNIFFSPINSFNLANHGKTYEEVVQHYYEALEGIAKENVRVYLSMAFHADKQQMDKAMKDATTLGCKVVLCDTDGTATNEQIYHSIRRAQVWTKQIALHLHNSSQMFQHITTAYALGVHEFDSSIGGMGGCPFVEGSMANLPTEDLVAWCDEQGITCNINLEDLEPALAIVKKIKDYAPTLHQ